jgi:hypothetical protein
MAEQTAPRRRLGSRLIGRCSCGRPGVVQIGLIAGAGDRSFCIRHLAGALQAIVFLLDSGADELEGDEQ